MVLAATPEERLFQGPQPSKYAAKARFASLVLFCLLVHVIPIGLVGYYGRGNSDLAPGEQEIPVEMIEEPPPREPEPPPAKSGQKPPQASLDEKTATDAPRADNDEKPLKDAHDEASHAPKPAQGDAASKPTEAAAPKPEDHPADATPIEAPQSEQPNTPEEKPAEQAAPRTAPQQQAAQDPLAAFSAMPDYSFAPASKNAPVTGGNSSSSYVSILYGMIFSRIHQTKFYGGEVNFIIDYSGRLVRARVIKSSGSPEADAAVIAAIRAASPFPPSPIGIELSMVLHY